MQLPADRRATVIADVVASNWRPQILESDAGPVEVLLHLGTGWALAAVPHGWIALHNLTAIIVREGLLPRVWKDKTTAMLELERLCPDCYGVDLPAPCATCEGTGELGAREGVARA